MKGIRKTKERKQLKKESFRVDLQAQLELSINCFSAIKRPNKSGCRYAIIESNFNALYKNLLLNYHFCLTRLTRLAGEK